MHDMPEHASLPVSMIPRRALEALSSYHLSSGSRLQCSGGKRRHERVCLRLRQAVRVQLRVSVDLLAPGQQPPDDSSSPRHPYSSSSPRQSMQNSLDPLSHPGVRVNTLEGAHLLVEMLSCSSNVECARICAGIAHPMRPCKLVHRCLHHVRICICIGYCLRTGRFIQPWSLFIGIVNRLHSGT